MLSKKINTSGHMGAIYIDFGARRGQFMPTFSDKMDPKSTMPHSGYRYECCNATATSFFVTNIPQTCESLNNIQFEIVLSDNCKHTVVQTIDS